MNAKTVTSCWCAEMWSSANIVTGAEEHVLPGVTPQDDVVQTTGNMKTGLASHGTQDTGSICSYTGTTPFVRAGTTPFVRATPFVRDPVCATTPFVRPRLCPTPSVPDPVCAAYQ